MLDVISVATVQGLKYRDTKRKSEKIRRTSVSEGGGGEELFEALKECNRVGPVLLLRNILCAAFPHKCVEEGQKF